VSSRFPADKIDGTHSPTKSPRSRSPENQSQTDRQNEMPAAVKKSALEAEIALRPERSVVGEEVEVEWVMRISSSYLGVV